MPEGGTDKLETSITHYIVLSSVLFIIGAFGVITRKNLIIVLMSLELMLNAVNLSFISFSKMLGDMTGHVFTIMTLTVAAAEVAVGLALVVSLYNQKKTLDIDVLKSLKG